MKKLIGRAIVVIFDAAAMAGAFALGVRAGEAAAGSTYRIEKTMKAGTDLVEGIARDAIPERGLIWFPPDQYANIRAAAFDSGLPYHEFIAAKMRGGAV